MNASENTEPPKGAVLAARRQLPSRCPSATIKLTSANGTTFYVTVQYDPKTDYRIQGVFYASGFRSGSELEFIISDACIIVSMLLQHGYTPDEILSRVSTTQGPNQTNQCGSLIGVIVQQIEKLGEGKSQ